MGGGNWENVSLEAPRKYTLETEVPSTVGEWVRGADY